MSRQVIMLTVKPGVFAQGALQALRATLRVDGRGAFDYECDSARLVDLDELHGPLARRMCVLRGRERRCLIPSACLLGCEKWKELMPEAAAALAELTREG